MHDRSPLLPAGWRGLVFDLHVAAVFLLRVPLPLLPAMPEGALARAMRLFPVVGALVGLAGGAVYAGALAVGLTPWLGAVLALAAMIRLTGGLHEDGLADTADGFGASVDRPRRLEIMRDSRIGTYGVLAVALALGLRAGALVAIAEPAHVAAALAAAGALSRAAMPFAMRLGRPARPDGLGALAAGGDDEDAFAAAALAVGQAVLLAVVLFRPAAAVLATLAMLAVASMAMFDARRRIGGYTGDVLGAVGQMVEVAVLLAVAATAAQGGS